MIQALPIKMTIKQCTSRSYWVGLFIPFKIGMKKFLISGDFLSSDNQK